MKVLFIGFFLENVNALVLKQELTYFIIIFVTTFIIAFTPLREYIPGYASTELKKNATELALKSDSLQKALKKNEIYIPMNWSGILKGKIKEVVFNKRGYRGKKAAW